MYEDFKAYQVVFFNRRNSLSAEDMNPVYVYS